MSEKMIFCSGDGRLISKGEGYQKHLRIFNQDVTEEEFSKAQSTRPSFELPIAKWVEKKDMTDEEKENWPSYSETGGFLKTLSYKDAWKEAWPKASKEFKDWVKNLPNFNAELFEKITGIKYENEVKEMTVAEISKALGFEVKVVK